MSTAILSPDRAAFREAVQTIAEKAKQTLPEANGRVDKAVALVLQGDVELHDDGTAQVFSQSNGVAAYHVVGRACDCDDYPRAPSHWCKHKIAVGLQQRALQAVAQQQPAPVVPEALPEPFPDNDPEPVAPAAPTPAPALPEAPTSVNCHILLEGRQVQLTLRDTDETRLLQRLAAVLKQYPAPAQPATQGPTPGQDKSWCHKHGVPMKQTTKDGRSWYSHYDQNAGRWCKGR